MAAGATGRAVVKVTRRRPADGPPSVEIDVLADEAGLHPEVVRRLVRLGLLDPAGGTTAAPLFPRDAAARLARATRLRRDLGLSYGAAVLVSQLLERIDDLEARLRRYEPLRDRRAGGLR
jgi:chaperone modulatory protein CbpM